MAELVLQMLFLPAVWVVFGILVLLTLLIVRVRQTGGPKRALLIGMLFWVAGSMAINLFLDELGARHLVASFIIAAFATTPMILMVVLLPWRLGRKNITIAGIAASMIGAFSVPYVALISSCALGIDCL